MTDDERLPDEILADFIAHKGTLVERAEARGALVNMVLTSRDDKRLLRALRAVAGEKVYLELVGDILAGSS